jgi:tetratricopeptide (TPR) repeat protein
MGTKLTFKSITTFFVLVSLWYINPLYAQDLEGETGVIVKPDNPTVKRQKKSVKSTKSAVTKAKEDSTAEQVEEALQKGNAARDAEPPLYSEAESAYQLASKLNPKDPRSYAGLGNIYFDQQRYMEAETAYRRAVDLNPSDAISYLHLSYTYNKLERYAEAEKAAKRTNALRPHAPLGYDALGWSLYKQQRYTEAETAYRQAIKLSPAHRDLYITLGRMLMEQKRYQDAIPIIEKTLELAANNSAKFSSLYAYGTALQKLGRLDQASEQYRQAMLLGLEAVKSNKRAMVMSQPKPMSKLALIYFTKENLIKAREQWQMAVRSGSTYEPDHVGLLILERKLDEARTRLESYTRANSEDEDGWLLLGDVYRFQGNSVQADNAYQKAALIAPDYARIPRPTPGNANSPNKRALLRKDRPSTVNDNERPRLPQKRGRARGGFPIQ